MTTRIRLTNGELGKLADYLTGSTRTLEDGVTALGYPPTSLDDVSLQGLDTLVFLCARCGWWYSIEDLIGNDVCQGCGTDDVVGVTSEEVEVSDFDVSSCELDDEPGESE